MEKITTKLGSHTWPLSVKSHSHPWGEGGDGHRWNGRGGGLGSLKSTPFSN